MPPRRTTLLAAAIGLVIAAGCSEEGAPSKSASTADPAPAATPEKGEVPEKGDAPSPITLEVTADKTHAVQPGDEIRLELKVEGFALDGAKIGADAQPGAGHYHVYLGDPGGEPLLVSAETSAVVKVPADVNDGTHSLWIQLRNHNHSPLDPPVEAKVRLIIYRL